MNNTTWKDKKEQFKVIDVRQLQGDFFLGLKKRAENLEVGQGLHIIQSFEPHPLYREFELLGFEHETEQVSDTEFHVFFHRQEIKQSEDKTPFRPLGLFNYPIIDENLGKIATDFWELTWQNPKRKLPYDIRLLLSLANAVGAGRMRQASRELIKAYHYGTETAVFDDVFELLAWNQGIGFFSSEIGPSPLFQVYKTIKKMEKQGKGREAICEKLQEKFGEKNPEISVG